jgi:predicted NUDIX family NTP pyrophosphohydrolase
MPNRSAGLLLYRRTRPDPEVLLVHPGGPFWIRRDDGAWSIPKGLIEGDESALAAAKREFKEETGFLPRGPFIELGSFKQPSRKLIFAWAVEGEFDPHSLKCNSFSLEWPPKSGRMQEFPEVDRAAWFKASEAARKITKGQLPIIRELFRRLAIKNSRQPNSSSSCP